MAYPEFTTTELASEQWRTVAGYEGFYEVSSLGRVRRIRRYLSALKPTLSGTINSVGYVMAHLSRDGKARPVAVHRLVATAFIGPKPAHLVINHIDGVKTNNRVSNLEYVTQRENHQHASRMGLKSHGDEHFARKHPERVRRGEQSNKAKLTAEQVRAIRQTFAAGGISKAALARAHGVSVGTVAFILSGKTWAHVH